MSLFFSPVAILSLNARCRDGLVIVLAAIFSLIVVVERLLGVPVAGSIGLLSPLRSSTSFW
ncbi:hypothetical protein [Rhizobium calliandrae]|uniref:hypothetical protein n=1 Tax=Rhizobium calliandrae TaxID=1312182 RepID=UPI003D80A545